MSEEQGTLEATESVESEVTSGEATTEEALSTEAASADLAPETTEPTVDLDSIKADLEASIRAEYEGPGGKLAKVQSARDKEMAELRRGQQAASAAKFVQAQQLAESDPAGAWQMANQEWGNQQQQQAIEQSHNQWGSYMQGRMESEGLAADDAEAQAMITATLPELAQQSIVNQSAATTIAMGLTDKLRDMANARKNETHKAEIKAAKAEGVEEAMATMDERFEEKMAQFAEELGVAPDSSVGGKGPSQPQVSYTKMSKYERDKAAGEARRAELKALYNK